MGEETQAGELQDLFKINFGASSINLVPLPANLTDSQTQLESLEGWVTSPSGVWPS